MQLMNNDSEVDAQLVKCRPILTVVIYSNAIFSRHPYSHGKQLFQ